MFFIEDELIPTFTSGDNRTRKRNKDYEAARQRALRAKKRGDVEAYNMAKAIQRSVSVHDPCDPDYRRLKYVRYADDSLLGLIGSKEDAEYIKMEIISCAKTMKLDVSEEKTLITHARSKWAKFLNYNICTMWENSQLAGKDHVKIRGKNGGIWLLIPKEVGDNWKQKVQKEGLIKHRAELMCHSDYDIIRSYESQIQGLINYYEMAHNVQKMMGNIRYMYKESLVKTLAAKFRIPTSKVYKKYDMYNADGKCVIAVKIEREGKRPLIASYGKKPIRQNRKGVLTDDKPKPKTNRTEILQRLLNNECELCGKIGNVEGHHIRKLAHIKEKKSKPDWMLKMITLRRKTLFVCNECHRKIHAGTYDQKRLT